MGGVLLVFKFISDWGREGKLKIELKKVCKFVYVKVNFDVFFFKKLF